MKELAHVATLARIPLTSEEAERFTKDLDDVLAAFATLAEIDTRGVEPAIRPLDAPALLREDEPLDSLEDPFGDCEHQDGFFVGPKVTR